MCDMEAVEQIGLNVRTYPGKVALHHEAWGGALLRVA